MDWGQGHISVGAQTLEYACFGPPPSDAPTLVMLHEGLGSVSAWRDLPSELSTLTGFGVLVYARPGYGRSSRRARPWPLDYMSREAQDVLPGVLDAAGVQRCVLLGHSDGASIAAIYSGSVSDLRVRGLILIAPHFFVEDMSLEAIRAARVAYEKGDLRARMARHHLDPDGVFYGWHDAWTDPEFADWSIGDAIDHWRIPSLVIQGKDDPYGSMAQVREVEERSYAPVETLCVPGAGHAPHRDDPRAVNAAIEAFCATLERLEHAPTTPR